MEGDPLGLEEFAQAQKPNALASLIGDTIREQAAATLRRQALMKLEKERQRGSQMSGNTDTQELDQQASTYFDAEENNNDIHTNMMQAWESFDKRI